MRDFLWKYFSLTGEIDAYLLYKEHEAKTLGRDAVKEGENGYMPSWPDPGYAN